VADEPAADALPGDAVVIRGGTMESLEDMRKNARAHNHKTRGREWANSVNTIPDFSVDEVARRAERPNKRICATTVESIRLQGYEVRSDWEEDGHANIVYESEPTDDDFERVISAFCGPFPNVAYPGREARV
jgi:hypothetical protein